MLNMLMAMGFTMAKSDAILCATPGYWIFTASFFPSFSAICTWPMLAAFTEVALKVSNRSLGDFPKYVLNVFKTNGADSGGTENCDNENFSTYTWGKILFSMLSI